MKKLLTLLIVFTFTAPSIFADWKLSQRMKMGGEAGEMGMAMVYTIYAKGVRKRTETKMEMDPKMAEMMEQARSMGIDMGKNMSLSPTYISMCDQKQDVYLSDPNKQFFVNYYDWSAAPPEKLAKRGKVTVTIKGTMTVDSWFEDSGKRQMMYGLQAKYGKFIQTSEVSRDVCNYFEPMRMEQEGWFVNLSLQSDNCPVHQDPPADGNICMPKMITKRVQLPGYLLTGTTKMYQQGKLLSTSSWETVDLSKATLDQALFEIPKDYFEVESMSLLMKRSANIDTTAKTVFGDGSKAQKTIAIDFFSGSANKIDQDGIRSYISSKVSSAGMSGYLVTSGSEAASGNFANVIGVEIKKVKESGAAKIGGLFGKVTGNTDAAKAGTSTADIVVTLYGKDGKTVVASSPATGEAKGSGSDAVKAAIDQVISGLLSKAK